MNCRGTITDREIPRNPMLSDTIFVYCSVRIFALNHVNTTEIAIALWHPSGTSIVFPLGSGSQKQVVAGLLASFGVVSQKRHTAMVQITNHTTGFFLNFSKSPGFLPRPTPNRLSALGWTCDSPWQLPLVSQVPHCSPP